jgi:hypothetical protein
MQLAASAIQNAANKLKRRQCHMGLDMYLTKELYIGFGNECNEVVIKNKEAGTEITITEPVKAIRMEAGYWRKANHIHNWFVKNVQEGNDNCEEHWVDIEDLIKLRNVCKQVEVEWGINKMLDDNSKDKIESLLPTAEGFFFGDTAYNEYYINDVKQTIKIIDDAFASAKEYEGKGISVDFYYRSSW